MQRCVPSLEIICRERGGVGVGVASGGVKKNSTRKGGHSREKLVHQFPQLSNC